MMEIGGQFHIKSTLSKSLWRGIDRYVKAWSQTNPDQYRDIELTADELVDDSDSTVKQKAISCFSGGLDACFTAYRHAKALAGPQSLPLKACLMLHGADIRKDYVDLQAIGWDIAITPTGPLVIEGNHNFSFEGIQASVLPLRHHFNTMLVPYSKAVQEGKLPWSGCK